MARCYLSRLSFETMRFMAGFAAPRSNFQIKRDIVVPDDLLDEVSPEATVWYARHQRHQRGEGVETNTMTGGFLKLVLNLYVFIQHSVLLKKQFPGHFRFQQPIFDSPRYRAYESRFNATYETIDDPSRIRLQSVVPDLTEHINAGFNQSCKSRTSLDIALIRKQSDLASMMVDVMNGTASIRISTLWAGSSSNNEGMGTGNGLESAGHQLPLRRPPRSPGQALHR